MAEALKASVPLLALVQDVPTGNRDRNAFQEFDHRTLFASCTKWVRSLDDPARVDEYVDAAMTAACSSRPGPVALLLPRDVLTMAAAGQAARGIRLGQYPLDRTMPAQDAVRQAAELIAGARSPILIAGGGVHLSGASAAIAELQEQASFPVGTTTMGKGAVDGLHPLCLGVVSNYMGQTSASHHLREFVRGADVVVFAGSRTNENGTDAWRAFGPDAAIIQIDVDSAEIGRNYEVTVRLPGDARLTCEALLDVLRALDLSTRRAARPGHRGANQRCATSAPAGRRQPDRQRRPARPSRAGRRRTGFRPRRPSRDRDGGRQLLHHLDGQLPARTPFRAALPVTAWASQASAGESR